MYERLIIVGLSILVIVGVIWYLFGDHDGE